MFHFIFSTLLKQNVSLLVILLCAWQINVNTKKQQVLGDVYYGVQIAYYTVIGSQLSILALSVVLMIGINTVSSHKFLMSHVKFEHFKFLKFITLNFHSFSYVMIYVKRRKSFSHTRLCDISHGKLWCDIKSITLKVSFIALKFRTFSSHGIWGIYIFSKEQDSNQVKRVLWNSILFPYFFTTTNIFNNNKNSLFFVLHEKNVNSFPHHVHLTFSHLSRICNRRTSD